MSAAETAVRPVRETSVSSGGFSHSQTGITAGVPVRAGAATMCGRCCSSERQRAAARSTKPESGEPGGGTGPPGTPRPMSSRVTCRSSRAASTSQIRSGTWPRGRWPFNQRATAVCS